MKPILLDIPEEILTPRLLLRPAMPGDGAATNEAVIESWDSLSPWMPWAQGDKPTPEESEELVRQGYSRWILREDLWMLIFDRQTKKFLGGTGLHRWDWNVPRTEIGYWCRTSAQGQGIITESTNALTRFAFQELKCKRVEIRCNSRNKGSEAIMKKLGFQREGELKNFDSHALGGGDLLIYGRTSDENLPALKVSWKGK